MACPGCGTVLKNFGSAGNHGKNAKDCTAVMRFWGRIKKVPSGCWLWQGAVNTTGYGMANLTGRKNIVAHRLAWTLLKGEIPAGMNALHRCDTPRCCNPDHIFLGTQLENGIDARSKGRTTKGRNLYHLTPEQVRELRRLKAEGMTYAALSARFGVSKNALCAAVTGRTWGNIE